MQSQERDLTRALNTGLSAEDIADQADQKNGKPVRRVVRSVRRITLDLDNVQKHNARMNKFSGKKSR